MKMTASVKGVVAIVLLVSGTSLAVAQGGDAYSTGSTKHHNRPMVTAPARHDTKHHFPMYLSAKRPQRLKDASHQ
jgi:hypothetical protein